MAFLSSSLRFDRPVVASFCFIDRSELDLMISLLHQAFLDSELSKDQKEKLACFYESFISFAADA